MVSIFLEKGGTAVKDKKAVEGIKRREFLYLSGAGVAAMTLIGTPELSHGAETKAAADEVFMMFPGNYTWSAAVRAAIGSSIGGEGRWARSTGCALL